jgi:hypothetical protein
MCRAECSLRCAENEDEPPSTTAEQVLKLECNISISTNFLISGILDVSGIHQSHFIYSSAESGSTNREKQSLARTIRYLYSVSAADDRTDLQEDSHLASAPILGCAHGMCGVPPASDTRSDSIGDETFSRSMRSSSEVAHKE